MTIAAGESSAWGAITPFLLTLLAVVMTGWKGRRMDGHE
jgi:hypothetical protein